VCVRSSPALLSSAPSPRKAIPPLNPGWLPPGFEDPMISAHMPCEAPPFAGRGRGLRANGATPKNRMPIYTPCTARNVLARRHPGGPRTLARGLFSWLETSLVSSTTLHDVPDPGARGEDDDLPHGDPTSASMKALPEASARCQGLALPVDLSGLQDLSGRSARRRCGCWPVWRWPEVRILSRIDEPILTLTFIPSTAQVLAAQLGDSDEGGRPAGSRPEKQAM
jgi:hypothetical protein